MNIRANPLGCLLTQLFYTLAKQKIDYCVIGNYHDLPYSTSNDVDIWVSDVRLSERALLSLSRGCGLALYMRNVTANGSNNYFYHETDNGVDLVKIDLMREVAYRSIFPIIESGAIMKNRQIYRSFFVASEELEAVLHLVYPLVTFGGVKDKYRSKLVNQVQNSRFVSCLQSVLGMELADAMLLAIGSEDWSLVERMAGDIRRRLISRTLLSFNIARTKVFVDFLRSIANRMLKRNGIMIAFTGIDGAGKSTIKNELVQISDRFFPKNRCSQYYWRPFILPRISAILGGKGQKEEYHDNGVRVVHGGFVGGVKGFIKYCYYVADFIIGQAKYFRVLHTGGVVVFDRYHFDNIVYPGRFGFVANRTLMRLVDRYLIPQPDVLFYFTANTNTLYDRKKEISKDEIESQKSMYENEIRLNGRICQIHTDGTMEESFDLVLVTCLRRMSARYVN